MICCMIVANANADDPPQTLYEPCWGYNDCSNEQYDKEQKCAKWYINGELQEQVCVFADVCGEHYSDDGSIKLTVDCEHLDEYYWYTDLLPSAGMIREMQSALKVGKFFMAVF